MAAPGLLDGFEAALDAALAAATSPDGGRLPGVVVLARRGGASYHKAFGCSDIASCAAMDKDDVFRMYSMTKVLTSTLALMLKDSVGEPSPDDEVSKYIPSFGRAWDILEDVPSDAGAAEAADVCSLCTGKTESVAFARRRANRPMLVKDLMAECSGIGYEFFSELDHAKGGVLATRRGYQLANAMRGRISPTVYKSSCILGHDLSLEEFCEVIASAGVLCTEPGTLSYGLGATVLGRVVEVIYAKHHAPLPLRDIFQELLFAPLAMDTAVFFDASLATRLPTLYGAAPLEAGSEPAIALAEESVPTMSPPYSNQSDHHSGPMKYDSGDTGSVMRVADYAKFLECLLRGGTGPDGTQIISAASVELLLRGRHADHSFESGVAKMMGLSNGGAEFCYGWVTQDKTESSPKQNYWSGYAGTHVRLYPDDDSYIIIGVQVMDHHGTGYLDRTLRQPVLSAWLNHWESQEAGNPQ